MLRAPGFNELSSLRESYASKRFASDILGLTIAPTIDCNLACKYCYEDKRPGRMAPAIERQLLDYVDSNLPGKRIFRVIWYGGEPLLCKDTIYRLSESFISAARLQGIDYSAEMVTNGLLLDRQTVDNLKALGSWRNFQITLDGTAAHHDLKRPRKGGASTFQRIFENTRYASIHLPVTLSMNVDRLNVSSCHDLLDLLNTEAVSVSRVRFCAIHPYGDGCRNINDTTDVSIMNNREFSKIEAELLAHASDLGIPVLDPMKKKVATTCQAVSTHSVVVEPDGTLQRCWTEVGNAKTSIGILGESIVINSDASMRWLSFDPTRNDPCQSCEVLPTCFGGCPQRHLDGRPMEMTCKSIRFDVLSRLRDEHLGTIRSSKPQRVIPIVPIQI